MRSLMLTFSVGPLALPLLAHGWFMNYERDIEPAEIDLDSITSELDRLDLDLILLNATTFNKGGLKLDPATLFTAIVLRPFFAKNSGELVAIHNDLLVYNVSNAFWLAILTLGTPWSFDSSLHPTRSPNPTDNGSQTLLRVYLWRGLSQSAATVLLL
ncbi:hypothetical protein C8F01DRAFT_1093990 [Mycena amicta]|nr:hypothetical protein C8F01DRAFT_1093990 [Mycena amicta]